MSLSNKAVMYIRVSSKDQEEHGYSLPVQKKYLEDYAKNHNLEIVKIFEETETAKVSGRRQFKAMIEYLRNNKETVNHVLAEKTDRLYRNFKDFVILDPSDKQDWANLNIHFPKENVIANKHLKANAKFMNTLKVLMASHYVDNLSEEVKKGLEGRLAEGKWPSCAPIGYINVPKNIIPDKDTAPLIKLAFEMASTGQYSLSKLKRKLFIEGLRAKRSKRELSKSQMVRILINPIYYGCFYWKGQFHKGDHEPIISKVLFDKVQEQMGFVKKSKSTKYSFIYSGVFKCEKCGCAMTADKKIKKSGKEYIYYKCTFGKGNCGNKKNVNQNKIDEQINQVLARFNITDEVIEWSRNMLLEAEYEEIKVKEQRISTLEAKSKVLRTKINRIYDDKLDGKITEEFWQTQNCRITEELVQTEIQLSNSTGDHPKNTYNAIKLMQIAKNAYKLFPLMNLEEKKEMVNLLLSNPVINDGSIRFHLKKPFDVLALHS